MLTLIISSSSSFISFIWKCITYFFETGMCSHSYFTGYHPMSAVHLTYVIFWRLVQLPHLCDLTVLSSSLPLDGLQCIGFQLTEECLKLVCWLRLLCTEGDILHSEKNKHSCNHHHVHVFLVWIMQLFGFSGLKAVQSVAVLL
jgi:hypothetical protein